jgi:hypothetical protein
MRILLFAFVLVPTLLLSQVPPVYVVLFTHIEDNTPAGTLGTPQSRQQYMLYRTRLVDVANLARTYHLPWSLQPDWKFLLAALMYEDSTVIPSTNNKNLLRYLKEDLGAVLDPHSHENGGYNYTDVAHLLDSLGVGATTVIGGHIWDPALPQFQEWDRFRNPVSGRRYPWARWRGNILMGSGTPNHVNDPIVSGVWRPQDRFHYFVHDSTANIAAIGQFRGTLESTRELNQIYMIGRVPTSCMLTSSYHIKPATITRAGGIAAIEDSVMRPARALRDSGIANFTDFTALVATWQSTFRSRGYVYDAQSPSGIESEVHSGASSFVLEPCYPNPFNSTTSIRFQVHFSTFVSLRVFNLLGQEVINLVNEQLAAGTHKSVFDAPHLPSGVYFVRLSAGSFNQSRKAVLVK